MKIEQIRQILEVYHTGSINKAAQNLYMAQSTLSATVRAVEDEFKTSIFVRTQNGITPTDFGVAFMEEGRDILKHYDAIVNMAISQAEKKHKTTFCVSVYFLLFATRAFFRLYHKYNTEKIDFRYNEDSRMQIIKDVADGSAELGLLMMPSIRRSQWLELLASYHLEYYILSRERPCVLVGNQCPLYYSEPEKISVDDLKEFTMIHIEETTPVFRMLENDILKVFSPKRHISISDRGSLMEMLRKTDGYYLATTNENAYKEDGFYQDIKSIPVTGVDFVQYEIGYVKRQMNVMSPLALEYITIIESMMKIE